MINQVEQVKGCEQETKPVVCHLVINVKEWMDYHGGIVWSLYQYLLLLLAMFSHVNQHQQKQLILISKRKKMVLIHVSLKFATSEFIWKICFRVSLSALTVFGKRQKQAQASIAFLSKVLVSINFF